MCILGLPKEQIGRYLSIVIVIICTNFRNTSFAIDPKTLFIAPDIFFCYPLSRSLHRFSDFVQIVNREVNLPPLCPKLQFTITYGPPTTTGLFVPHPRCNLGLSTINFALSACSLSLPSSIANHFWDNRLHARVASQLILSRTWVSQGWGR